MRDVGVFKGYAVQILVIQDLCTVEVNSKPSYLL